MVRFDGTCVRATDRSIVIRVARDASRTTNIARFLPRRGRPRREQELPPRSPPAPPLPPEDDEPTDGVIDAPASLTANVVIIQGSLEAEEGIDSLGRNAGHQTGGTLRSPYPRAA